MDYSYVAQDLMNTPVTQEYLQALTQKFIMDNLSQEQRMEFYKLSQENDQETITHFLQTKISEFEIKLEEYISTNFMELLKKSNA